MNPYTVAALALGVAAAGGLAACIHIYLKFRREDTDHD